MSEQENSPQTLVSHLLELRQRLLKMIIAVGVILLLLSPFMQQLFSLLTKPLLNVLPEGLSLIHI